ncbi:type II toxin-antitoxin system RelE/ParE family toxin [Mesonia sp. K4-1]|jgi:plasmid stabilization system protein ParE|uniref:type II toxin-antitoxin system RelE/ParE family toxin n=1 Tax=Mesonia sp. K4-1 TaxID=2602760 RepID=UPI0011C7259F|nr:type II toxin-antitoxin system RelE/ParE family toxin [Mesonia sp. K4-1]TXK77863.1 type II toxin-antitoxin system RelE/ParE family toxin [Mesonia sp. K4-1]
MKVFLSELAESKLLKLSQYLLEEWNLKTRDKFLSKLNDKIKQISIQPQSCPKSSQFKNLYKCVLTKQTTIYYRIAIEKKEIEIITIFDTRQNLDKLKKDIK